MSICLIGLNHKTAPIDVREQLAITHVDLPAALADFQQQFNHAGLLILSTCNRVELLASHISAKDLIQWLSSYHQINHSLEPYCYCYENEHAIEHAMQVACGIDSLVLGEPQILGQFKQAYQMSKTAGVLDSDLELACQHIFNAAKAVRHETAIGHCPVSVAFSAIKLAHKTIEDIPEHHVLLVGAGETAKLICKHLQALGVHRLTIVNRTLEKAELLSQKFTAHARPLSALPHLVSQADIIITATNSPRPLITEDMIQQPLHQRGILMIDLSVPRNIAPTINAYDFVNLHCVDDLKMLIQNNTLQRSQAATQANAMIEQFIQDYQDKLKMRHASGIISSLHAYATSLRDEALEKALKQLEIGMPAEAVLKQFANTLTNQFTHHPSIALKTASIEGDYSMLTAANRLFTLTTSNPPLRKRVGDKKESDA